MRLLFALMLAAVAFAPLGLAAPPAHAAVENAAPQVDSVSLGDQDDDEASPGVQVSPRSGQNRTVFLNVTIRDNNGHADVSGVTVGVGRPDGGAHRAAAPASKASGNGRLATYTFAFPMSHHDAPGTYSLSVEGTDQRGGKGETSVTFEYAGLVAQATPAGLAVVEEGATLTPGGNTSEAPAALVVTNAGNVVIDVDVSGTALAGPDAASLPVSDVRYSLDSSASALRTGTQLATSPARIADFDLAPGASSSKAIHVAVFVSLQDHLPAGTYAGTMTVTAVANG